MKEVRFNSYRKDTTTAQCKHCSPPCRSSVLAFRLDERDRDSSEREDGSKLNKSVSVFFLYPGSAPMHDAITRTKKEEQTEEPEKRGKEEQKQLHRTRQCG